MNRGVLQSSPVQQMMAGNPNWWIINNNMKPPLSSSSSTLHHHQQQQQFLSPNYLPSSTNHLSPYSPFIFTPSSPSSFASNWHQEHQDQHQIPAESWSQLLMGGLMGCEDKGNNNNMGIFQGKKMEDWEEQVLNYHHHQPQAVDVDDHVNQDNSSSYVYEHATNDHHLQDFQQPKATTTTTNWPPHQMMPITSSPNSSSLTSFSNNSSTNMLEFFTLKGDTTGRHPPPDRSSESNSSGSGGGAVKKARVQGSSTTGTGQTTFKVRKEKLGDRITALHQLVSPFGKTDTASVLLEAIGYIRFLQSQIEALSLPYLGSGSPNMGHQKSVDSFAEVKKDLKSRGLCLVPVSCTLQVGSDNGGDYWAPAIGGSFQ